MDSTEHADPIARFRHWLDEAEKAEPDLATAMTLATADAEGRLSGRMVLLKGADERGFVFYTNLESRKAAELAANPNCALVFHWKSLQRQVRIAGRAEPVTEAEADAYFASRPRGAQIGAWASEQSREMAHGFELETRVARFTAKFGIGAVPRPPFWSGYRVVPREIEFWEEGTFRLHRRTVFRRDGAEDGWATARLFP